MAPEIMRYNGEEEYTEKVRSHFILLKLVLILNFKIGKNYIGVRFKGVYGVWYN